MFRLVCLTAVCALVVAGPVSGGVQISGDYVESRTCDIYTGPCFANSEVGCTGSEAVMAWRIEQGEFAGVDLSGLNVAMVVKASATLAWGSGFVSNPHPIRTLVIVDQRATSQQREALAAFARHSAGRAAGETVRVDVAEIHFEIDQVDRTARVTAGELVEIQTRALGRGDCVCSNEEVYYSPLAKVDNAAPAYSLMNRFSGIGLGMRWENPNARSAFLATFAY